MLADPVICRCTVSPTITDVFSLNNASTVLTWNPPSCHEDSIFSYDIQFITRCGASQPPNVYHLNTSRNSIVTSLIDLNLCTTGECYIRIRGVLSSRSFTSFSSCVLVNHFTLNRRNTRSKLHSRQSIIDRSNQ